MPFLSKVCEKRSRRRADAESCTANVAESAREQERLKKKKTHSVFTHDVLLLAGRQTTPGYSSSTSAMLLWVKNSPARGLK